MSGWQLRWADDEFDASKDDWQEYVEDLVFYFVANGIEDTIKEASSFSCCDHVQDTMQSDISSQARRKDLPMLLKHYRPGPSEIVEWLKFHSRSRKAGELSKHLFWSCRH